MNERTSGEPLAQRQVALIDLLDRLLSGGVVIAGDVVLSVAGVDLVRASLRALVASVGTAGDPFAPLPLDAPGDDDGR
ncbi:gas vesicle protein [Streptomyces purpureus]|uniref:gas vesicle protein n=1 Tax=Streptomyces purpureus TaxID=1951 RepID=UPI0003A12018|nr:gas vesicle protein [Streptomyces purpureus]